MFVQKFTKVMRPAARLCTFRQSALVAANMRLFSSVELVARSSAKLSKALDKEIKYENDNYNQLEDIETFIRESGWTYSEEEEGVRMSLTKTVADKKVEVIFEARYVTLTLTNQCNLDNHKLTRRARKRTKNTKSPRV